MGTYIVREASVDLFSVAQIQKFYVAYHDPAVDLRSDKCIADALVEGAIFVLTDSFNQIKGCFNSYSEQPQGRNHEYVELGSNRIAPELQGFGLLPLQIYIRIFSEITKRIENMNSLNLPIFHVNTLSYLPQVAKTFRRLEFSEVPRTDLHDYPYIKSANELKESLYFIMPASQIRNYLPIFAKDFLNRLKTFGYPMNGSDPRILLTHRVKNASILVEMNLDILSNPSKFNRIQAWARNEKIDF